MTVKPDFKGTLNISEMIPNRHGYYRPLSDTWPK